MFNIRNIRIKVSDEIGEVSGLIISPENAIAALVLSHGAGAGMDHPFMESLAIKLAAHKIATLRFNFPFKEKGSGPPDRPKKAHPTILAAVETAFDEFKGLPIIVGGKSFGGRMTSQIAAEQKLQQIAGIVYYGFPLHAPGKYGKERAAHLPQIAVPQLFLQGTRDTLARIDLIKEVTQEIEGAKLVIFEGRDHSFKTLKKLGISHEESIMLLAEETASFVKNH